MEKQKYKIIFIDIDGTLVNDEKQVTQRTINTIKKLFSESDTPPKFYQMKSDSKDVYHLKWDKSV